MTDDELKQSLIKQIGEEDFARALITVMSDDGPYSREGAYFIPDTKQIVETCGWRDGKFVQWDPTREYPDVRYESALIAASELLLYNMVAEQANSILEQFGVSV